MLVLIAYDYNGHSIAEAHISKEKDPMRAAHALMEAVFDDCEIQPRTGAIYNGQYRGYFTVIDDVEEYVVTVLAEDTDYLSVYTG